MATRGEEGWHAANRAAFGEERWRSLLDALHRDTEHLVFPNPFLAKAGLREVKAAYKMMETSIPWMHTFELPEDPEQHFVAAPGNGEGAIFVEPRRRPEEPVWDWRLAPFAMIDGASALTAMALGVEEGEAVLDVCAAPGGRAILHAAALFVPKPKVFAPGEDRSSVLPNGRLVCNEAVKSRAGLLQRTVGAFLPEELLDSTQTQKPAVIFTSADPGTSHNSMERLGLYDRVLLAPPCVDDRELLRSGALAERWSQGAIKVSAERQLKLLKNALWLLRDGGVLLYCVPALSEQECDGVIEQLLNKSRQSFKLEVLPVEDRMWRAVPGAGLEPTDWGARLLPDRTPFGPIYFCRLRLVERLHAAA